MVQVRRGGPTVATACYRRPVRRRALCVYAAAFCEIIPMILNVILGRPVTSRSPALCWRRVMYAEAICELRTHSHDLTRHPGPSGDVLLSCVVLEAGACAPSHLMYAAAACALTLMILHVILGRPTSRSPASCRRRVCATPRTRCMRRPSVKLLP